MTNDGSSLVTIDANYHSVYSKATGELMIGAITNNPSILSTTALIFQQGRVMLEGSRKHGFV